MGYIRLDHVSVWMKNIFAFDVLLFYILAMLAEYNQNGQIRLRRPIGRMNLSYLTGRLASSC